MANREWLLVGALLLMPPLSSVTQAGQQEVRGSEDVSDFVRGIHADSISYDAAREYTEHSEVLLAMLENGDDAPYWPNITMVLGFTGHSALVDPLIDFLHGGNNDIPWSTAVYRGRASAITALGYLIHHNTAEDDEAIGRAMEYLRASVVPQKWIEREIPWLIARGNDSERERLCMRLSTSAVLSLALTGRDEAAGELHQLADGGDGVPARLRQVAESALPHWERIKKDGLAEYYRTSEQGAIASRR